MKFLVIGLGSMGKRRIRCLKYLKEENIIGFDLRKDRCTEAKDKYGIETFLNFQDALAQSPDVFVISVPSNLHHHYALEAYKNKKHFFTESNFLSEGIDDLMKIEEKREIMAVPSFTMPHHPSIKLMKRFVKEGKTGEVYFFTYHLAACLPLWHPWEDYRKVYYSQKETPGCREMVAFELTWLVWLLGKIKKVSAFKGKISDLEIEIDDIYQIILEFENGILGHLLIEIISQPSRREMKMAGEKGTLLWHSEGGYVKFFDNEKRAWEEYPEEEGIVEPGYSLRTHEEMYIEEIEDFVKTLKKEKAYPYTFREENDIIGILEAIDKSAQENKAVEIIWR